MKPKNLKLTSEEMAFIEERRKSIDGITKEMEALKATSPERRYIESAVEVRMAPLQEGDQNAPPVLYGYALKFNKRTNIGWYDEVILPGALDGVIARSDCKAVLNHDSNFVMARSKYGEGTLSLSVDNVGLRFEFTPPESRADVVEMVQRGDLDQCSFKFVKNEVNWVEKEGERELRQIVSIDRLYDVALVAEPAYIDTSVALRCRQEYRSAQGITDDDPHPDEIHRLQEEQRDADLYLMNLSINNIDNQIKNLG